MITVWKALVLALAFQAAAMGVAAGAISCATAILDLLPCLSFVTGDAVNPTVACCNGVKSLNAAATSTPLRQAVCRCIESVAGSSTYDSSNVVNLLSLCSVNVGIPITTSISCDTYSLFPSPSSSLHLVLSTLIIVASCFLFVDWYICVYSVDIYICLWFS